MLPPGQAAFAYFIARFVAKREITAIGFLVLATGAIFPTVSNAALIELRPYHSIHNWWTHSLVTVLALWVIIGLIYTIRVPYRQLPLLFVIGYTCQILTDPLFDMMTLYLSVRTNDVGGAWLFPFADINIRHPRLEPGYLIWPWRLLVEFILLALALRHWSRGRADKIKGRATS